MFDWIKQRWNERKKRKQYEEKNRKEYLKTSRTCGSCCNEPELIDDLTSLSIVESILDVASSAASAVCDCISDIDLSD